jgi:P22_AR N-terminal domain
MSDETTDEPQVEVSITKVVDFYGDQIPAAQGADGEVYVPINPLTAFLGLNRVGQIQRIKRDPVLSKRLRTIKIDTGGGTQSQICVPLDLLPGWLFGITTGKMGAELQEKLNRYRAEAFKVLWDAFKGDILPYTPATTQTGLTTAEQNVEIAAALYRMAQQQLDLERRVVNVEGKQDAMGNYMRGFIQDTRSRLTSLEMRLDPASVITEQQAADLAIAVKTLAHELEEQGNVGSYVNGYQKVYSEMYRRYNIKSYKNLPRNRYEAVLAWLREWYDEVKKEEGTSKLAG